MSGQIDAFARSDRGAVRQSNEDALLARTPVFVVADGMGGHARGDAASAAAIAALERSIPAGDASTPDAVLDAIANANSRVRALSEAGDSGFAVAGTTLSGLVLVRTAGNDERHWMVVNVGDSRVYTWDGRTLGQVTVDHSAVQELLDAGAITDAEAASHPERNVITRALGADASVEVDVWLLPATGRQCFLVCSDGLCRELSDQQIARVLAEVGAPDDAHASIADALVDAAVEAGGRDNVSVIVVESQLGRTLGFGDGTIDRVSPSREILEDTRPRS